MDLNYFKDILFDLLNESDALDVIDIVCSDRENRMQVCVSDGSAFEIQCSTGGKTETQQN